MSAEFGWTRTADHVRLARGACDQSCCLAANLSQLDQTIRSNLLICTAGTSGSNGTSSGSSSGSSSTSSSTSSSSSSSSSNNGGREEAKNRGLVDCLPFHLNTWLESNISNDPKWNRSSVVVRIIGTTPDALLADHLYQSIRHEVGLRLRDPTTTADGHWTERMASQLPKDNHLTVLLDGIDRLDSWGLVSADKVPDNLRLIVTCSSLPKDVRAGWTIVESLIRSDPAETPASQPPVSWSRHPILSRPVATLVDARPAELDAILTEFFDETERQFPVELVRKTCAALNLASSSSGLTEDELRSCLEHVSTGDSLQQHLTPFIEFLDPLLIRMAPIPTASASTAATAASAAAAAVALERSRGSPETVSNENQLETALEPCPALCWSRPALTFTRQRYAESEATVTAGFVAVPSGNSQVDYYALRWTSRFLSVFGDSDLSLERGKVEEILFNWNTWRLIARAGHLGLQLVSAAVRLAAVRWVDSHIWLLERNLPWINQADGDRQHEHLMPQHLAAQMAVALKPYAEKESHHQHLWRLYQGAQTECDQLAGPVLVATSCGWNWNHSGKPLERKVDVLQREQIQLLAASPDGQSLVVVTADPVDPFFSLSAATGRRMAVYKGHSGRVTCLGVTGDSRHVISGSEDLSVIVWDMIKGHHILRIREHIAPVSCVSSVLSGQMVVTGGEDSIVMAFQWPGQGDRLVRIDHHRGPVTALVINHREDVLVSGSQDGSVCLWSLEDWTLLNSIDVGQSVGHVTLSSDDVFLLAVGLEDGLPRLYSLTTGSALRTWTDLPIKIAGAVIVGGNGHSYAALMALDGRLMCYDCHSGQLIHTLSIDYPGKSPEPTSCCSRTDDPRLLFHSVGNKIKVWLLRYEEKRPLTVNSPITYLAASPIDGAVVAAGDRAGGVQLLRASNLSKIAQWSHSAPISVVSFDAVGLYIASAAEDGTAAVWHLDAGQTLPATQIHQAGARVNQLAIMADWNGYVLSCDSTETIVQWKLGTGEVIRQWVTAASKLLVVANNTRWMAGSTRSNSVRLWSLESAEENKEVVAVSHAEEVLCLAPTPDSRFIITGSRDSSLKMWEVLAGPTEKGGKLVQIMAGHSDYVTAVVTAQVANVPALANTPNSKHLLVVSGSRDGQLIIWDAQHGSEIHSMRRHVAAVTCLKVTSDGSVVVSGSEDGTVRVWNLRLGTSLSSFALACPVYQIVMSPDASKLWVRMAQKPVPAVLDLRHTPAVLVKTEVASRPASPVHLRKAPPTRRLLKKEISLDSYTWLKRYGSKSGQQPTVPHHHHPEPQKAPQVQHTPSVESLLKLSRRNSFCNVPESGET